MFIQSEKSLAASSAPVTQSAGTMPMGALHYSPQATIQRKVIKQKAGAWVSDKDPYTVFPTRSAATVYDIGLKGRERLRARVPTLYTYTHTKPHNKLGHTTQGPHVVAHRVTLHGIQKLKSKAQIKKLMRKQVPSPADVDDLMDDEAPPSGYTGTMEKQVDRYLTDYQTIHTDTTTELAKANPDIIAAKHNVNILMNMHPYATSGWKTSAKASKSKLAGKGENMANPTFDDLVDPPRKPFNNTQEYDDFIDMREKMFDDL